jgi:hypothetical protein
MIWTIGASFSAIARQLPYPKPYQAVGPGIVDATLGAAAISTIAKAQQTTSVPESPTRTRPIFIQFLTAQAGSRVPTPLATSNTPSDCAVNNSCTKAKPVAPTIQKRRIALRAPSNDSTLRGSVFAQLASLKDKRRISGEWLRLNRASPNLLKGWEPVVETADLGQRGIYYRILVGPFEELQIAEAFCATRHKERKGCVVRQRPIAASRLQKNPQKAAVEMVRQGNPEAVPPQAPVRHPTLAPVAVVATVNPVSIAPSTTETSTMPMMKVISYIHDNSVPGS